MTFYVRTFPFGEPVRWHGHVVPDDVPELADILWFACCGRAHATELEAAVCGQRKAASFEADESGAQRAIADLRRAIAPSRPFQRHHVTGLTYGSPPEYP